MQAQMLLLKSNQILYLQVSALMEMFSGGPLEHKVMERAGCVDYSATEWELLNRNVYQRRISFRFDKSLSRYGGEATTTQQKYNLPNQNDWIVEEVMTLQGVQNEDYSSVRSWKQSSMKALGCFTQFFR